MHPQKVAVVLDDQVWTYSELTEEVERVAHHLYRLHVAQGQIVYQFVERGLEMICGMLGIMCAGGVYCLLNPADQHERVVSVLGQIDGQCVLLHGITRHKFPSTAVPHVVRLDDILVPLLRVEDIDDIPDF
ncbi:unnamed protein product [Rotaria sp. Silwood1]|nr:unnamed protein product [Rotaria sp. Silwood1]